MILSVSTASECRKRQTFWNHWAVAILLTSTESQSHARRSTYFSPACLHLAWFKPSWAWAPGHGQAQAAHTYLLLSGTSQLSMPCLFNENSRNTRTRMVALQDQAGDLTLPLPPSLAISSPMPPKQGGIFFPWMPVAGEVGKIHWPVIKFVTIMANQMPWGEMDTLKMESANILPSHRHRLLLLSCANRWSVLSDKCNTAFLILNLPMWMSAEPPKHLNLKDVMSLWYDSVGSHWRGVHSQQEKLPSGNGTLVTQSVTLSCWVSTSHPAPMACWRGLLCVSWWAHCKLSTLERIFEVCRV